MKKLNYMYMFIFLSAVTGVTLVLHYAAADWLNQTYFNFLIWNLFLGWIPFLFSSITYGLSRLKWKGALLLAIPSAMMWLLFFPNSSYIITDLLHLTTRSSRYFSQNTTEYKYWYDLMVVLMFVWAGLLVGFVSMYQIQQVIYERWGRALSWIFVIGGTALASYGVLLGRVYRLNSWDAFTNRDLLVSLMQESVRRPSLAFCMFFGTFLLTVYLTFYYLMNARGVTPRNTESFDKQM